MDANLQNSLIDAINIIVKENINQTKYTSSNVGLVKSVKGFDCIVEMQDSEVSCTLMEHLHDWVDVDDIVIVQDLYNNNIKRAVIGKVGTSRPVSLTIFDDNKGKSVSGVEHLYDQSEDEKVNVVLDLE